MPTDTQHSHNNEQQMDAVVIQASGPPAQSLAYRSEPVPEPGPGEVLVEVHAAAVNPLDVANAAGLLGTPLPMIPGGDYAGIVVSDGARAGQEVWGSGPALGMALGMKRPGTHARFVRPIVFRGLADGNQRHGAHARRDDPHHRRSRHGRPGRHRDRPLARRGADRCRPAQARRRSALHRHQLKRHTRGGARTYRWARC